MPVLDRFLDYSFRARSAAALAGEALPPVADLVLGGVMFRGSLIADAAEAAKQAIKDDDVRSAVAGIGFRDSPLYDALFELAQGPTQRRFRAVAAACFARDDLEVVSDLALRMRVYLALLGDGKFATEVNVLSMLHASRTPRRRLAFTLAATAWHEIAVLCRPDSMRTRTVVSNEDDHDISHVAAFYRQHWKREVVYAESEFRSAFAEVPAHD